MWIYEVGRETGARDETPEALNGLTSRAQLSLSHTIQVETYNPAPGRVRPELNTGETGRSARRLYNKGGASGIRMVRKGSGKLGERGGTAGSYKTAAQSQC